jgi:hypothetical protein
MGLKLNYVMVYKGRAFIVDEREKNRVQQFIIENPDKIMMGEVDIYIESEKSLDDIVNKTSKVSWVERQREYHEDRWKRDEITFKELSSILKEL